MSKITSVQSLPLTDRDMNKGIAVYNAFANTLAAARDGRPAAIVDNNGQTVDFLVDAQAQLAVQGRETYLTRGSRVYSLNVNA